VRGLEETRTELSAEALLGSDARELAKDTDATKAWIAEVDGRPVFVKLYPPDKRDSWARVERAIAGSVRHPAIVPLERVVSCLDGDLFVYPRVDGLNLADQDARRCFRALPSAEREDAVFAVVGALAAVCDAGFTVVDWYEGNMIYDFEAKRIWLFDWELCRSGPSFILEMESNYGSTRLMAPEEFVRGSTIDERTLVFNLGRFALLNLPERAETLADVLACATHPSKVRRYGEVREFLAALGALRLSGTETQNLEPSGSSRRSRNRRPRHPIPRS